MGLHVTIANRVQSTVIYNCSDHKALLYVHRYCTYVYTIQDNTTIIIMAWQFDSIQSFILEFVLGENAIEIELYWK